jgi:hypothetical protein
VQPSIFLKLWKTDYREAKQKKMKELNIELNSVRRVELIGMLVILGYTVSVMLKFMDRI